jgi:hypothetical protein
MFHILPHQLLSWNAVAGAGELLWFPVYFIVIYQNYKQKVCGMPIVGICAILAQCFIYSTFGPYWRPDLFPHNPVEPATFGVIWIWRGWLLVQATVLVQFFLYHDHAKNPLELPVSRRNLRWLVAALLLVNLFGQWTFITFYHDYNVNQSDPLAYFFMALGFVLLAIARPKSEGLSYSAAWLKMIGTALIFLTIFVRPVASFGSFAMQGSKDPRAAQQKACPMPPVVEGETCGVPPEGEACEPMEIICEGKPWVGVTRDGATSSDCTPDVASVLAARVPLESEGWLITSPDTVYRSDIGELDLIRVTDPRGALWCPETTKWDVVNRVDGQFRFHFQFPLFMCLAGVFLDCMYIVLLHRRRKAARAATAGR